MAEWIASDAQLRDAVASWPAVIGLDTEFLRTSTYYPKPGLYQVAAGDQVYLIDPLAIESWQPLVDYLVSERTVKVMHACLEDLELLHHHLGISPRNVFDTQFANAFASENFSLSYAALVERVLGVSLPKHETRSNWLQRPLSDDQIRYAVEDVIYLAPLYEHLQEKLQADARYAWFVQEMSLRGAYVPPEPLQYYRGVKKAWQLGAEQLAVLQMLCAWRENTARSEDVPRNRVVWDDHLYAFSRIRELELEHVHTNLPRGIARRYAEALLEAHNVGRRSAHPEPLPRPLTTAQGKLVKQLREIAGNVADQLGVAPELLSRRRDIEACVRHFSSTQQLSDHYLGWREGLVAERFLEVLQR